MLTELQWVKRMMSCQIVLISRGYFFQSLPNISCLLPSKIIWKYYRVHLTHGNYVIETSKSCPKCKWHGTRRTKLKMKSENSLFKAFLAVLSLLGASYYLSVWEKYTFDCNSICLSVCLPTGSLSFNPSIYLLASFLIHHTLANVDKISPLPRVLLEQLEMVVIFFRYHM